MPQLLVIGAFNSVFLDFLVCMLPSISVIVPVYNAEKYLVDCLSSVANQSFHNYEVIIVNDGSSDSSAAIAESFASQDIRFVLFNQQNAGVTAARRKGIENANGDYVFFLDADDTLAENSLEILSKNMGEKWDIIVAQSQDSSCYSGCECITIDEYRRRLIFFTIQVAPWGKLIKRTLFTETTLDVPKEIKVGEDWIMNLRLSFNTEKEVLVIPDRVYFYNRNDESVIATFKPKIEYERNFYPYLIASIPNSYKEPYVPLITNYVINCWVRYTSNMLRLSDVAQEFRKALKVHYREGYPGLPCLSRLIFLNTLFVCRLPLIAVYKGRNVIYPKMKKLCCHAFKYVLRRCLKELFNV